MQDMKEEFAYKIFCEKKIADKGPFRRDVLMRG